MQKGFAVRPAKSFLRLKTGRKAYASLPVIIYISLL